jgi:hypothetical protein
MLAFSIHRQLHTHSHLVLKLKKDWIYTSNALNDILGRMFSLPQGTFTCSFHFKQSKYSIWQLTYFVTGVENILFYFYIDIYSPLQHFSQTILLPFFIFMPLNLRLPAVTHLIMQWTQYRLTKNYYKATSFQVILTLGSKFTVAVTKGDASTVIALTAACLLPLTPKAGKYWVTTVAVILTSTHAIS